jgi:hypothetical protein
LNVHTYGRDLIIPKPDGKRSGYEIIERFGPYDDFIENRCHPITAGGFKSQPGNDCKTLLEPEHRSGGKYKISCFGCSIAGLDEGGEFKTQSKSFAIKDIYTRWETDGKIIFNIFEIVCGFILVEFDQGQYETEISRHFWINKDWGFGRLRKTGYSR